MSNVKSKEAVKVEVGTKEDEAVGEIAKVGTVVTGIAAALVGAWGVVCLVAATLTEGPINLIKGLFGSVQ